MSQHENAQIGKLTDRQKACLRLVAAGFQSKEIGPRMGLSSHTVDQHLREAIRVLGVSRRLEAARLLISSEGDTQSLIGQPLSMADTCPSPPFFASLEQGDVTDEAEFTGVQDSATEAYQPQSPLDRLQHGQRLSWSTKLLYILAIAILSVLAFGGLLAGLQALSRLI